MSRAALYLRVSTEEQAREGFSLAAQEERLRGFVAAQDWEVHGVFADEGFSGKNLDRPGLRRLIDEAERRLYQVVVVWRLDRLSRRQADALHLIEDVFAQHQIGFRSATEPFDTTSPAGMAMVGMLAVFAQLERATIIERTRLGLRQRTLSGRWSGTPPWGYRYGDKGVLEPDPATALWVKALFERAADPVHGMGIQTLARWCQDQGVPAPLGRKTWHFSTVRNILGNRAYLGERLLNGRWVQSGHEPVISAELYQNTQHALKGRRNGIRPRRGEATGYLLSGLAFCGYCGARLRGRRQRWPNGNSERYYVCRAKFAGHTPDCGAGWLQAGQVEEAVVGKIRRLTADPTEILAALGQDSEHSLEAELTQVEAALASCTRRQRRLLVAVEKGLLSDKQVQQRSRELLLEEAALRVRREGLVAREPEVSAPQMTGLVTDFHRLFRLADHGEQKALLGGLLQKALVWRGPRVTLIPSCNGTV